MIISRHQTKSAADRKAAEYRKNDYNNNYYVILSAKGTCTYAVVMSEKSEYQTSY